MAEAISESVFVDQGENASLDGGHSRVELHVHA